MIISCSTSNLKYLMHIQDKNKFTNDTIQSPVISQRAKALSIFLCANYLFASNFGKDFKNSYDLAFLTQRRK